MQTQINSVAAFKMGTGTMCKFNRIFVLTIFILSSVFAGAFVTGQNDSAYANDDKHGGYLKISKEAIGKNKTVKIGLDKSMVIDLPGDAHDILVASPDVADAITRTSRRVYIFARQIGTTNLFIFDVNGNQLLSLNIQVERDTSALEKNLKKFIPGSDVKVEIVNDNIILTGTVPTPQASLRVIQLTQAFLSGGEATTNAFQNNSTSLTGGGNFIVGQEARQQSQIVNLIRIEAEDQVHLKVTIAEIQRTIVKQLGIDITAAGLQAGNLDFNALTDNPFGLGNPLSGSAIGANYQSSGGETIDGVLRALDQAGVMRTLAEPSLTAISGETASFNVGGEFNVPDGPGGTRTVDFGVSLSFTPVVLGPGRISLQINTEVSEPTTEGAISSPRGLIATPQVVDGVLQSASDLNRNAGGTALGIRRREASTTVELPSGGSMVLAGLLRDDVRQAVSGFPGLSKIPVLGTLFRSRDFLRSESELVIIATPYLVRPVARQKLARPDDNFQPSSDGAANFLGRLNRVYGKVEGDLPEGRYHGKVGFIFK